MIIKTITTPLRYFENIHNDKGEQHIVFVTITVHHARNFNIPGVTSLHIMVGRIPFRCKMTYVFSKSKLYGKIR